MGIQRTMLRLLNHTNRVVADKKSLGLVGMRGYWAENEAVLSEPGDAGMIGAYARGATTAQLVYAGHRNDVIALEQGLERWRLETPSPKFTTLPARTQVGSWMIWHTCQILVMRSIREVDRGHHRVQASAMAILELCVEAGDKIEYSNWPLLIASSVLTSQTLREQARGILKIFAYQCCNEINVIREVMEGMWQRMDEGCDDRTCHYYEVMKEIGKPMLLG